MFECVGELTMYLRKPRPFKLTRATMHLLRDTLLCMLVFTLTVGLGVLVLYYDPSGETAFPRLGGTLEVVIALIGLIARLVWWYTDRRLELASEDFIDC